MNTTTISVSSPADFHVHLRQGDLSELVTPHVRKGGFHLAYVMVILHFDIPNVVEVPPLAKSHTTDHHHRTGIGIQI